LMPLSGFPELLPEQRFVELTVLDRLQRTFELHGFAPLETPAVESLDTLVRKSAGGEIDKEVYVLRRLHADPDGGDSGLGLHFDLTVPFARYVLEHAGHLEFPFRRYQIQKVWRGERPQDGRYREFTQADIDVIGADTLAFHHDAEMALVMADVFARLPLPPLRMQVNNRKLIEGFYRGLGIDDVPGVLRAVDKLDKVGAAQVHGVLTSEVGLSATQAESCLQLAQISGTGSGVAERVRALGVTHEQLDRGLDELLAVLDAVAGAGRPGFEIVADLRIARGLDYYTGTVYETQMQGFEHVGSVCSGGRYDALASDGRTTYPGVGISFGVTRTLGPLFSRDALHASRSTPTCVLVALPDEASRPLAAGVASSLRGRGVPTEVAPEASKYGKQIKFAERRGIPFVWFPRAESGGHEVRDIRSGDQVPADPTTWLPAADDLRPRVSGQPAG
ncbi:MAG: histidyl-tRNA synthetase, partial [Actinomycetota bacterium]|nr:histidyl-tRNA synthetase [Actinomycetota bacterium]